MIQRITFVTIGQTPRSDLVPELVSALPRRVEVREVGALDGLEDDAIRAMAPLPEGDALVTRLRDGREVVLGKEHVVERLRALAPSVGKPWGSEEGTTGDGVAADHVTVLLCTGRFPELGFGGLVLDAQRLVDLGVEALSHGASTLGLLVPLARQAAEGAARPPVVTRTAHASPYDADADFAAAGRSLKPCDLVVMHCMGYTESQRDAVAEGSGRPVLLARRLVAAAVGQLL